MFLNCGPNVTVSQTLEIPALTSSVKIQVCIYSLDIGKPHWHGLPSISWTSTVSLHSYSNYHCLPQLFCSLLLWLPPPTSVPQQPVLHLAVKRVLENRKQSRSVLGRTGASPCPLTSFSPITWTLTLPQRAEPHSYCTALLFVIASTEKTVWVKILLTAPSPCPCMLSQRSFA